MTNLIAGEYFIVGAFLLIGGVLLLFGGAWLLSRALAEATRARAHRISADEQEALTEEAHKAVQEVKSYRLQDNDDYRAPTDDELRQSIMMDRDEPDITTSGNEEIEEEAPIPPDSLYNKSEPFA